MIKFATVGAGWIMVCFWSGKDVGPEFVHAAVYSFRQEEGEAFAKKHGVDRVYTDLDELGKSDIDAVYIANPQCATLSYSQKTFKLWKACSLRKDVRGYLRTVKRAVSDSR